ncbi:cysteine-rich repeat secretory protein 38-like [Populus nigra]|uniref:cysteine-rich repeat secretory protein 38-like n=1 Tax=Populus nigra TaxID=3691 RepID=UPI002B26F04A|nr:cysteine-rich repeat secretory protein 38-like [Populus nigra]
MSSSRLTSSLYLLTFALLLQNVLGTDPLFTRCSSNENSTANSSYKTSLNVLMGSLYHLAPVEGFALGSLGQNNQDRPYGLVLCRGDVSSSDCRTCAANATREIRKRCPNGKSAIIAYDNCLLKYSDSNFFGQIDENKFSTFTVNNVSNPVLFKEKTTELLSQLADKASYNSSKLYAAGEMDLLEGSRKLYGMAQCTRDLSSVDCKKCLDGTIGALPGVAYGNEGTAVGGSCMVIYAIHPFVKA